MCFAPNAPFLSNFLDHEQLAQIFPVSRCEISKKPGIELKKQDVNYLIIRIPNGALL